DDAAGRISIFGGEVTRLQVEFLNGVRIWKGQARVQIRIVMARGIELELRLPLTRAVYAGGLFAGIETALAADGAGVAPQVHSSWRQIHQPLRPSPLQRQFRNLLLANQLAAGRRPRL